MNRLIVFSLFILTRSFSYAQSGDVLHIPEYKAFVMSGYVGNKINLCINNGILKTDENYLVEPFRHKEEERQWQSEFWGKWLTSAADAYRYTKDKRLLEKLKNAVNGLLATQMPDGYIGNYAPAYRLKEWDIWGMKYCLLGLLDYYDLTRDGATLIAMKKLADYVITSVKKSDIPFYRLGNYKGMAAASILEPIVRLYGVTKNEPYLDFAKYIVDSWKDPQSAQLIIKALNHIPVGKRFPVPSSWYGPDNGQKAYEMMSCYEGLLELYRVTGEKDYLNAVLAAANDICESEIMITGSGASMECWFGGAFMQSVPTKHTMETCVTVTWLKLCFQLLQVTGDGKWANEIEKGYYNALLGAMKPDGSTWSKYIGMEGVKVLGEDQCGMHTNCCIANGPRGIMVAAKAALLAGRNMVAVNFYTPLKAGLLLNNDQKKPVEIEMATGYPASNRVQIKVIPGEMSAFALLLRVPEWAHQFTITVNGEKVAADIKDHYARVDRNWSKGDVVEISFEMEVRPFRLENDPYHVALLYGPLVLAVDKRYNESPFYQAYERFDEHGKIACRVSGSKYGGLLDIWVPLRKEADGLVQQNEEICFTDFATAGNTWSAASAYKVWLQEVRNVSKENIKTQ
ncbi:beta-L-arabinofuranosidase domain-containing protein [Parafilimonas sp.]|uniref:beta-L-arabinofuranosidase domain-containing protein n=1 Tax=Parafilimonas sp. TaxID=1969739 RepID=UPI0039E26B0F